MAPHRRAADDPRGILAALPGPIDHRRLLPRASLAPIVAHFWSVRWRLDAPFEAETLPHPSVHLVFEDGAARRGEAHGVVTGRFVRRLQGEGEVFGIKLRPATFATLSDASVARLTDRVVPLERALGDDTKALVEAILDAPDLDAKIAAAETFLEARATPPSEEVVALRDLVERVATDRSLVRVEDLAALAALDVRTLQRRFRRHVGVAPKWVIQRYRLHEAAAQLASPTPPALAELAAALGYADQAHFTRDFKRVIGTTPRRHRARARP